jgi:hypothetical protein
VTDVFTIAAWVVMLCMAAYALALTYTGVRDLLVPAEAEPALRCPRCYCDDCTEYYDDES